RYPLFLNIRQKAAARTLLPTSEPVPRNMSDFALGIVNLFTSLFPTRHSGLRIGKQPPGRFPSAGVYSWQVPNRTDSPRDVGLRVCACAIHMRRQIPLRLIRLFQSSGIHAPG